jgi:ABC-type lipopolysaccharide export system ATPase subunit
MKLHCENLVKKYGLRTVVKGVSMEVEQGEIVGFLGPNGAGKTTSFYMITGQIVPNDGKVFLPPDWSIDDNDPALAAGIRAIPGVADGDAIIIGGADDRNTAINAALTAAFELI